MKIAFVPGYNPFDIHYSSGTPYHILRALHNRGLKVTSIYSDTRIINKGSFTLFNRFKKAVDEGILINKLKYMTKNVYYNKIISKTYLRVYEPSYLKFHTAQAELKINETDCDLIFTWGNQLAAYLNTVKPLVFWYDSTFAGIIDIYKPFSKLCDETRRHGHRADELALLKCQLAIYSSDWAAKSAIDYYGADPEKVKVVPFGANIICNRSHQDIINIVEKKSSDTFKLFFMGTNWHNKGGETALEVAKTLNQRGLKTELHLAGCNPPKDLPQFVVSHGFISKKTEQGRNLLDKLYSEAHFFILPSKYESFGIVFAEASSFGLPSLATRVGGVPTAVRDGINGQTFSLDDEAGKYCDYIEGLMSHREKYKELALSTFNEYLTRLNWSTSVQKVHDYILRTCL